MHEMCVGLELSSWAGDLVVVMRSPNEMRC